MPKKLTTEIFIERAKAKHKNNYDYSKINYKNFNTKVIIGCPIHGEFMQRPGDHLRGHDCARCGNKRGSIKETLTTEEFINRVQIIYNHKYNYSKVQYENSHKKVIILCPDHGEFTIKPNGHLNGISCSKCSNGNISKLERRWIKQLNISSLETQKRIYIKENKYYKPDGYDPKTNTVYEFFGDYWHGNPSRFDPKDINQTNKKSFGELYNQTITKIEEYEQQRYNVVYIWESDFLTTIQRTNYERL